MADVQETKLFLYQAVQCASKSHISTPTPFLLHPFVSLCFSLPEMNNVDPLIVLYEQSDSLAGILSEDWRATGLSTGPPL